MRSLLQLLREVPFFTPFHAVDRSLLAPHRRVASPHAVQRRFALPIAALPPRLLRALPLRWLLLSALSARASAASTSAPFRPPSRRKSTTSTSSPRRKTGRTAGCIAPTCCPFSNTSNRTTTGSCSGPVCGIRPCWIRSNSVVLDVEKSDF